MMTVSWAKDSDLVLFQETEPWAPRNKQQKTSQEGTFRKGGGGCELGRTTPSTVSVMTKAKEA